MTGRRQPSLTQGKAHPLLRFVDRDIGQIEVVMQQTADRETLRDCWDGIDEVAAGNRVRISQPPRSE
jgi:hypothetical protein